MFSENDALEPEELMIGLKYLQSFEPAGVGARSPAECLALQLKALPADTPFRTEALKIVDGHLPLLAARDFTKLRRVLHCDEACVQGVRELIRSLNPRPGASFAKDEANYVIPDVVVRKVRNQWVASLNEAAMPKLRLNRIYADILTRNRESSNQQLAAQLQEAKWLIRNVQQRFETILRVAQAIVERQRRFFEHGEVAMRPMVLREIADMLDLHESTISRVTTQKYMLTPRGTFELKYFFGSHVATDTGGAASATAIRALIKQLIAAENPQSPLTDSRIAELLGEQGIIVARRTIAKYREALSIPPVNLRKALRTSGLVCDVAKNRTYPPQGELDEPEPHRRSPRHHPRHSRLRRVQARAREPAFRPRDRRERGAVGGQAATEDRGERARARQGHPRRGDRARHVRGHRLPGRQAQPAGAEVQGEALRPPRRPRDDRAPAGHVRCRPAMTAE